MGSGFAAAVAAVMGEEAALDVGERLIGGVLGRAFALQVAAKGSEAERGGYGAALHVGTLAAAAAQQAAARVAGDIGALCGALFLIHGHHIAVAGLEEGLAPTARAGGHIIPSGRTAGHSVCSGFWPLHYFPEAAITPLFKASDDQSQMGGVAILRNDGLAYLD